MFRPLILGLALAGSLATHVMAEVDHDRTCRYFENRANGHRQGDHGAWISLLSKSCAEAAVRFGRHASEADAVYLDRLGALRDVVVDMNVRRFTGPASRGSMISRTVTASGEYLIARRIGVMDAYAAWADATGFDTAALPSP